MQTQNMTFSGKISIHALHTESDLNASIIQAGILKSHFYPRSPYGERPNAVPTERTVNRISIHALHTESDERSHLSSARLFAISIHALHTVSDQTEEYKNIALLDFYPRSPYGERPWQENNDDIVDAFLSTLSIRRATSGQGDIRLGRWNFYPRSPYGERRLSGFAASARMKFLSTLSIRRATATGYKKYVTFCLVCPNSRMKGI